MARTSTRKPVATAPAAEAAQAATEHLEAFAIRSRVRELRYIRAGDLASHPINTRLHPEEQEAFVTGALKKHGHLQALTGIDVRGPDGQPMVLLINGRLRLVITLKQPGGEGAMLPVNLLDTSGVTEAEIVEWIVIIDEAAAMADIHPQGVQDAAEILRMLPAADQETSYARAILGNMEDDLRRLMAADAEVESRTLRDMSASRHETASTGSAAREALEYEPGHRGGPPAPSDRDAPPAPSHGTEDPGGAAATDLNGSTGEMKRDDVPDVIYPADNSWGVPLLLLEMQATHIDLPVTAWGDISRGAVMPGTYHFYIHDYKFSALFDDPTKLVNSRCKNVVEPNYSSGPGTPAAVVLWGIYRKRWMARWWQEHGVHVFVDLNVHSAFADLALLGVPQGWRAYATRGLTDHLDVLAARFRKAREHALDQTPLFLVVGGGRSVEQWANERADQGAVFIPEKMHQAEGRVERFGAA